MILLYGFVVTYYGDSIWLFISISVSWALSSCIIWLILGWWCRSSNFIGQNWLDALCEHLKHWHGFKVSRNLSIQLLLNDCLGLLLLLLFSSQDFCFLSFTMGVIVDDVCQEQINHIINFLKSVSIIVSNSCLVSCCNWHSSFGMFHEVWYLDTEISTSGIKFLTSHVNRKLS